MKFWRTYKIIILLLTLVPICAWTQEEENFYEVEYETDLYEEVGRVYLLEFGLDLSDPVGTFDEYMESPGFGVSIEALMQAKPSASYFWGVDYRYQMFQSVSNVHDELQDGVYYTFDSRATVNLMNLSLKYRYYPSFSIWIFEPYLEGGLGLNWWYTYFSSRDIEIEDEYNSRFEEGDISFSYSMSAGIQFPVSDLVYINSKVEYAPGNTSEYHARNDLSNFGNPLEAYNLRKTTTDLVRYVLGVTLAF